MNPSQKTILIIDDEDPLREVVRSVLEGAGYRVLEAENGEQGLEKALHILPDLVLCDIEMPRMSGFEVLNLFRQNEATAIVPFVFLTGRGDHGDIRRGMELGADDFLTKPFGTGDLLQSVKTRLQRKDKERAHVEQKLESLRQNISTSVPHELRTPLTGILGFARILKEQAQSSSPEDLSEIADHIIASAERLERTLERFWVFTEIRFLGSDERSRAVLRKESILRADSLLKLLTRERAESFKRGEDVMFDIPGVVGLQISENHAREIFSEVLENAFKFSSPRTPVAVACRSSQDPHFCQIEISDRGRGMDKKNLDAIGGFMQFDRKRYEQQGLGMGLAIAKELARLYGGNLTVRSTPGEGTTVVILLPLVHDQPS